MRDGLSARPTWRPPPGTVLLLVATHLIRAVEAWVADWNEHPRPFVWHKTADQIFDNLTGYLNRIPNSGH